MKKFIILLVCLTVFGGAIMCLSGCSFFAKNYVTNESSINESFSDISIKTKATDIELVLSQNEACKVICYEHKKANHSVSVQDGELTITLIENRKWYERWGGSLGKITLYLPQSEYGSLIIDANTGDIKIPSEFNFGNIDFSLSTGDVKNGASANNIKVKTTTGNVYFEGVNADEINISVTTGNIIQTSVACDNSLSATVNTGKVKITDARLGGLSSTGSTGDIVLENVFVVGVLDVTRSTGNIKFVSCDASEITAKTTTGNVVGSLLSDKIFITKTDTGRVDVPETESGGKCKITTNTGNIKITIK